MRITSRPLNATKAFTCSVLGAIGLTTGVTATAEERTDPIVPYDRSLYALWTDDDNDCQDTRQEVLIAESLRPVEFDEAGCRVVEGSWFDPYTALMVTNPSELDIDHLVPLAEAHRSGADAWDAELRQRFANDLSQVDGLIAVTSSVNRSKYCSKSSERMTSRAFRIRLLTASSSVRTLSLIHI